MSSEMLQGEKVSVFGDFILYPPGKDDTLEKKKVSFFSILTGPLNVCWTITERCNLKCLHCFNNSGSSKSLELNTDEALTIADQIIEVHPFNLCFCGGEPLLRKDLPIIARKLSNGGVYLSMVTNGMLLTREKADELANVGFSDIQISIDGAVAETHDYMRGIKGSFDKAIEGARNVVEKGMTLAVAFTPTKFNIDEFPKFVELMISIGVSSIRVQPIMPMGRCIENEGDLIPSGDEYFRLVWTIKQKQMEYVDKKVIFEWGDPLEHIYFYSTLGHIPHFLDIEVDGSIKLSPYIPVTVGNLKKNTIKEYWDAGLNEKWKDFKVREYAEQLMTLDGMKKLSPRPFYEPNVILEVLN